MNKKKNDRLENEDYKLLNEQLRTQTGRKNRSFKQLSPGRAAVANRRPLTAAKQGNLFRTTTSQNQLRHYSFERQNRMRPKNLAGDAKMHQSFRNMKNLRFNGLELTTSCDGPLS